MPAADKRRQGYGCDLQDWNSSFSNNNFNRCLYAIQCISKSVGPVSGSGQHIIKHKNQYFAFCSLYICWHECIFIHLYVSKFKKGLIKLYFVSIACLIILFAVGRGNVLGVLINKPYGPMLLIPLSLCLGFITAKEAFCFKLMEGYLLAMIMPFYLLLLSAGGMTIKGASYGLILIAAMLLFHPQEGINADTLRYRRQISLYVMSYGSIATLTFKSLYPSNSFKISLFIDLYMRNATTRLAAKG